MKALSISILTIAFTGRSPSFAQDTVCFGLSCDRDSSELPDIFEVYNQLAQINSYNARQTFSYLGVGNDETREQCIQRCQQEFSSWISACAASYPSANPDEDVTVSQGRVNCATEGNRRQLECLTPANFSKCP